MQSNVLTSFLSAQSCVVARSEVLLVSSEFQKNREVLLFFSKAPKALTG